jgi:hypothetical protein
MWVAARTVKNFPYIRRSCTEPPSFILPPINFLSITCTFEYRFGTALAPSFAKHKSTQETLAERYRK